jgi:hypothetical protein
MFKKISTVFVATAVSTFTLFSSQAMAVLGFEVSPQDVDRIVVIGLEAQVQMLHQPSATKLKVSGIDDSSEPGNFALERRDRVLYIKMQEFGDKSEWKTALSRPKQKRILEFVGASVPVEIQLRDGQVMAKNWARDLRVVMTRGKFTTVGGTGTVHLQLQRGDALIQDQTSKVTADLYRGQLVVKNLQGDLDGSVFSGGINIEKSKGYLNLNTTQSVARVLQSSGTLQFENVKGNVITQQFAGRVEGQTGEGSVNIGIVPDTDVHVKSVSGRVTVQTAAGSGAFVNLLTSEGEITAPNEIATAKTATEKTARGRLRGGEQKGSIVVRSREGSIVLK